MSQERVLFENHMRSRKKNKVVPRSQWFRVERLDQHGACVEQKSEPQGWSIAGHQAKDQQQQAHRWGAHSPNNNGYPHADLEVRKC